VFLRKRRKKAYFILKLTNNCCTIEYSVIIEMDIYEANTTMITTTVAPGPVYPVYSGYLGLAVAVFFFGSNYLPVKKYETGDGMVGKS
jgi:hypothetical protein